MPRSQDIADPEHEQMDQAEAQQDARTPQIDSGSGYPAPFEALQLQGKPQPEQEGKQGIELAVNHGQMQKIDQPVSLPSQFDTLLRTKIFPTAEEADIGQEDTEQRKPTECVQNLVAFSTCGRRDLSLDFYC